MIIAEQCYKGFRFGPANVYPGMADETKGCVIVTVATMKGYVDIYVTKTGKIRIVDDDGEWQKPKEKTE